MTHISVLQSIIHVYAALYLFVASKNRIKFGVLLLTTRTRHFPLTHEGVPVLKIGGHQWTRRIFNRTLEVVSGRSDETHMMFSSSA